MKQQPHDMIGLRRGKLTIVAHSPRTEQDGKNSPAKYIAKCDCGDFGWSGYWASALVPYAKFKNEDTAVMFKLKYQELE